MSRRVIIAIDGPSGAGKSTIARRLAARLGFVYIDTGAMYRAVAVWALRLGLDLEDATRLAQLAREAQIGFVPGDSTVTLNGEDVTQAIREPSVSDAASRVSAVPGVRRAMVEEQRRLGAQTSVVMEGRDIGTVVFPEADVKIFLEADPRVRAERRLRELREKGVDPAPDALASEMQARDQRDRTRADSPLLQAPDAVLVDTSGLTIEQVEELLLKLIRERTANGKDFSR